MHPNESVILEEIQSGQTEKFALLYEHYIRPLYRFVYYKTHQKEVAEDLTAIIFLKAFEQIHRYNPKKASFQTWLYQIARYRIIDYYRTERKNLRVEDAWDISSGEELERDTGVRLDFERLQACLKDFSSIQRDILLMRLWEGLSYKEIAQIVGKSEAACKMQFGRGVSRLREVLPLSIFISFLGNIV